MQRSNWASLLLTSKIFNELTSQTVKKKKKKKKDQKCLAVLMSKNIESKFLTFVGVLETNLGFDPEARPPLTTRAGIRRLLGCILLDRRLVIQNLPADFRDDDAGGRFRVVKSMKKKKKKNVEST
jgi:hypothetical protein